MIAKQPNLSKWYLQYFDAFFTAVTGGYLLYNAAMFMPEKEVAYNSAHFAVGYPYLVLSAVACGVYTAIIHKREKAGKFNSEKAHAVFFGLIRYWLAAGICCYGFAKILGVQFRGANEIILRDSLLGDISGNYLTWYYFNFSHPFMLIIGYLQIGGSLLLLFRRTTLAGVFVLLPVMVNITMIDLFYGVPRMPTILAIVFTTALIYLVLLHSRQLAALFFKTVYSLPNAGKPGLKNILRIAVVAFAFMSIYHEVLKYKDMPQPVTSVLAGKWKLEPTFMNGRTILPQAWASDSGRWGAIYFFGPGYCAISSNAYYYDRTKANFGKYSLDTSRHLLKIYFFNTKDSLQASIDFISTQTILMKGLLGKDSVSMQLTRVKM